MGRWIFEMRRNFIIAKVCIAVFQDQWTSGLHLSIRAAKCWLKLQNQEALVFQLLYSASQGVWLALNQAHFIVSSLSLSACLSF